MNNGGFLGLESFILNPRMGGVFSNRDRDFFDCAGKPFPTSGLVHHWPLTSNANDVVGSLHLTNNNGVTFSELGAKFTATSSQSLTATHTLPTSFAWVCDFNLGSSGRFMLGNAESNIVRSLAIVINENSDDKTVLFNTRTAYDLCYTTLNHNFRDSLFHRLIINVNADLEARRMVAMYVDTPVPKLVGVTEFGITMSTYFAVGKRGAANQLFADGYIRDLVEYDRSLLLPEISWFMSRRA